MATSASLGETPHETMPRTSLRNEGAILPMRGLLEPPQKIAGQSILGFTNTFIEHFDPVL